MSRTTADVPKRSITVEPLVISVGGAVEVLDARLYFGESSRQKFNLLLVFFHSGGFLHGSLAESDAFLRTLVESIPGLLILASRYTLATQSPFPAAVDDAHSILEWARVHRNQIRWTGEKLVVGGIEAGAHVASVSNMISNDRGGPTISGQILITPMVDPSLSTRSMRECPGDGNLALSCETSYRSYFSSINDRLHPYASPLQSSRLKMMAPALIVAADGDPLRDEAELLAHKLNSFGVATDLVHIDTEVLCSARERLNVAHSVAVIEAVEGFLGKLNSKLNS